ncbi:hypothetical protein Tco_0307150 [Tanacetum coccineum]
MMSCNNDMKDEKSSDTESPINKMHELKIRDEFLKILRDNAFNGTDKGDMIDHISKILEITKWIKIPDVDMNELRLYVFSKLLSGDAKQWWNNKIEGTNIDMDESVFVTSSNKGFAAALAVLVTGASQSRQHGNLSGTHMLLCGGIKLS